MERTSSCLAAVAAALIGYAAGTWNAGTVSAARFGRDPAKELLDLDREFDAATTKDGVEGWVSYFAPDGVMLPSGRDIVIGQDAIRGYISKAFATPGFALRWEPEDAGASGDLGYTYGVSKVTRTGANGKPVVAYGKYVTIWRRQHDRSWKIVVDIGNSNPAPAAKAK